MYIACAVITCAYFVATYILDFPASISSTICMSLPSIVVFFILSKYKDARFFLTFCFVDTVTLILAFLARYICVQFGIVGNIITLIGLVAILISIFVVGKPYFRRYRNLLEYADSGLGVMMMSSVIIYFALIFMASYPKPLVERLEYAPPYLVFSMVIISSYMVFITSLYKTRKIYQQSEEIAKNMKWYHIAYIDGLTGCSNRMAYIKKINEIERIHTSKMEISIIVFDLDNFKKVNDEKGHSTGDLVLRGVAHLISRVFSGSGYSIYRLGGDEFAVISDGKAEKEIVQKIELVYSKMKSYGDPYICGISAGFSFLDSKENNAMAKAFERADKNMYIEKNNKKDIAK